jgi:hypothetical protein
MPFSHEELLLLSYGRRVSPDTSARLAKDRLTQEQTARWLAVAAGRKQRPRTRRRLARLRWRAGRLPPANGIEPGATSEPGTVREPRSPDRRPARQG